MADREMDFLWSVYLMKQGEQGCQGEGINETTVRKEKGDVGGVQEEDAGMERGTMESVYHQRVEELGKLERLTVRMAEISVFVCQKHQSFPQSSQAP